MSSMFKLVMLINIESVRDTKLYDMIKKEFEDNKNKTKTETIYVRK